MSASINHRAAEDGKWIVLIESNNRWKPTGSATEYTEAHYLCRFFNRLTNKATRIVSLAGDVLTEVRPMAS